MKKPNIVYILADDMGYGDISALNENCGFKTKYMDEMAERGVCFTDAHATAAVCTPSRYGILTGRYNWRSRLKSHVMGGYSEPLIEEGRETVADLLRENGYRTVMVGKWHLGMNFATEEGFVEKPDFDACDCVNYKGRITRSPIENGFDYFYGISASLDMPPYLYIENDHFTAEPDHITKGTGKGFFREGPTAPDFCQEKVLDELTDRVLEQVEISKDQPFFLYFAMPAPHTPILPAEKFRGKSGTNEYGDFVLHCDDVVGRINGKLDELGILENTIVIMTSDNGCSPGADYPELIAKGHNPSYHFRGAKADIYEGGHRVPFIVQWRDKIPAGQTCDRLICLSDLTATLADLLSIELKPETAVDSVSNLPLWFKPNGEEVREDLIHQSIDGSLSIRHGNDKLELCKGSGGWSNPKPGEEAEDAPEFQLYDLSKDIGEQVNLIDQHPEVAEELKKRLVQHIRNGRSTKGPIQRNNGEEVWDTVLWLRNELEGETQEVYIMTITNAGIEDLKEILELQYLAYQSEARLLNNFQIPPLKQTLEEICREYHNGIILKAINDYGKIIGSVRGYADDQTLYIGKLMVHPDEQGKGIGTDLLNEIEKYFEHTRCELFTSSKSVGNLKLYEKAGYQIFKEQEMGEGLTYLYMEKYVSAKKVGAVETNSSTMDLLYHKPDRAE